MQKAIPACPSMRAKHEGCFLHGAEEGHMQKKETPMRVIDLAIQVREAFYQLPNRKLEAMLNDEIGCWDDLFELAWDVVPKIFPVRGSQTVNQLLDLAVDMPELMTQEPDEIQDLRFDYDLLLLTPLRVLHANVIDLAMRFAKDDVTNFPRIKRLSADSRHVYNMMQKRYVLEGFAASGCVLIEGVQQEVFGRLGWNFAEKARTLMREMIEQGFVEQRQCSAEAYQLTYTERSELIERYQLVNKWPRSSFDEIVDVKRALSEIQQQSASSEEFL
jgi:hypothetical protein